jgi:hypothetical protein
MVVALPVEILKIASGVLLKLGIVGTSLMVIYLLVLMLEIADLKKVTITFCSIFMVVWLLVIACGVLMII